MPNDTAIAALTGLGPRRGDYEQLRGSADELQRVAGTEATKLEAATANFESAQRQATEALMASAARRGEETVRDNAVREDFQNSIFSVEAQLRESGRRKAELVADLYANREIMQAPDPSFAQDPIGALFGNQRKELARQKAQLAAVRLTEQDAIEASLLQTYQQLDQFLRQTEDAAVTEAANRAAVQQAAAEGAKATLGAVETAARIRTGAASSAVSAAQTNIETRMQELNAEMQRLQLPLELRQRKMSLAMQEIQLAQMGEDWKDEAERNAAYDALAQETEIPRGVLRGMAATPAEAAQILALSQGRNPRIPTTVDEVDTLQTFAPALRKNFRYFEDTISNARTVTETARDAQGRILPGTFQLTTEEGEPTPFAVAMQTTRDAILADLTGKEVGRDFVNSAQFASQIQNPVAAAYAQMLNEQSVQGKFTADLLLDKGDARQVYDFMNAATQYVNQNLGLPLLGSTGAMPTRFMVSAPASGPFGIGQSRKYADTPITSVDDLVAAIQRRRNAEKQDRLAPQLAQQFTLRRDR